MTLLTKVALYFSLLVPVDCVDVPVSSEEEAALRQAAHEARRESLSYDDYESISISKCITPWNYGEEVSLVDRSENFHLYGVFSHRVENNKYRERFSISCHSSVDIRGDERTSHGPRCHETLERYMHHEGLDKEVRLTENISVESATAFLDYLLRYEPLGDSQERFRKMLQKIETVRWHRARGRYYFEASYNDNICSWTFEAWARDEIPQTFMELSGSNGCA